MVLSSSSYIFFFFNDTATTEIYTLSLHDALPIFRPLDRGEHIRPHREQRGSTGNLELQQRLPRVHRADHRDRAILDREVDDVLSERTPQPRRHARGEVLPRCAGGEHHRSVAAARDALGRGARVALRGIQGERRVRQRDHFVRAVPAHLLRALHGTRRQDQRVYAPAQRVGQPARARHDLVGHFAQRAVALLAHREDVTHRTLASSRNRRTSSGTAAGPSPTIFPSLRSGGGVRAKISSPPLPSDTVLTSKGFFFAAMIPLSAG